jgi:alkanesulfonate monooxygenase SsuD/methylene tetrahydromethanopterin reductase-like flavin-dependent oxidoreductase (luciferase family)
MRRVAAACDAAGFFYLAVSDHVAVPRVTRRRMSTMWYDAIATLGSWPPTRNASASCRTCGWRRIRHPLVTAKAFATLDALSNGRIILGVGAGHVEAEFAALGIDFTRRGKLLDEAIDLVVAAWTDEYPTHDGATWSVRDLGQQPRPVQQPRPPIWIGGSTPAALRRVAERGDGWLPQGVPRWGCRPRSSDQPARPQPAATRRSSSA